jgi:hypothetical protein
VSITIFSAPQLPRGRVIVVQDGLVVADGMLDDLITVDEDDAVHSTSTCIRTTPPISTRGAGRSASGAELSERIIPIRKGITVNPPTAPPLSPPFKFGIEHALLLASARMAVAGELVLFVEGFLWFEPIAKAHPVSSAGAAIVLGGAGFWLAIQREGCGLMPAAVAPGYWWIARVDGSGLQIVHVANDLPDDADQERASSAAGSRACARRVSVVSSSRRRWR